MTTPTRRGLLSMGPRFLCGAGRQASPGPADRLAAPFPRERRHPEPRTSTAPEVKYVQFFTVASRHTTDSVLEAPALKRALRHLAVHGCRHHPVYRSTMSLGVHGLWTLRDGRRSPKGCSF